VLPALILDPATRERIGRSPRRAAYFCAAARALEGRLRERGSALTVRRGPLVATTLRLARECGVRAVVWSAPYDSASLERSRVLQSSLEEAGFVAEYVHDAPAVSPDDTAAARSSDGGAGYRALVPYIAAWKLQTRGRFAKEVAFVARDDSADSDERDPSRQLPHPDDFAQPGIDRAPASLEETLEINEVAARARLERFLAGPALEYRAARNIPGGEPTSRLSADLSFGLISARAVLAALETRAADPFLLAEERHSLDAFARALATRDFFLQLGWFFERPNDAPLQERMRAFVFARAHPALEAWREGRTGFPLVDAGARQLRATGWMHPRVRLVAASFLCFDLGVDWRVGRDCWEAHLIEDDPALANGNWQWVAGVGADLAQFPRIYNPNKQARSFDPLGRYVRRWIPELAGLPDAAVLDPVSIARRRQLSLPLFDGAAYPAPVVDHTVRARAFLQRYTAFVAGKAGGASPHRAGSGHTPNPPEA
jgi:deoxyribodipyrimidine photo-lyase